MALPTTYLLTVRNLEAFLNAIVSAEAPERFTQKFLSQLEFTSSNDRLFIGLLKGLGFIEESGVPTQRYFNYLDQTRSKAVLADALREAYSDLFTVNKKAHELSIEEVKNKLRTLTQGKKSDRVLSYMATTFTKLCELADWTKPKEHQSDKAQLKVEKPLVKEGGTEEKKPIESGAFGLHYNIQIHLPESRDPAVFDAIFRSLKEHLF